jgi:hypothetical protein
VGTIDRENLEILSALPFDQTRYLRGRAIGRHAIWIEESYSAGAVFRELVDFP